MFTKYLRSIFLNVALELYDDFFYLNMCSFLFHRMINFLLENNLKCSD